MQKRYFQIAPSIHVNICVSPNGILLLNFASILWLSKDRLKIIQLEDLRFNNKYYV